jgi:predicted secreted hydrolase
MRATIVVILSLFLMVSSKVEDFSTAHAIESPVFSQALPGHIYQFPKDFNSHDDFRIEWWYYTGNLEEVETSRPFGYQLTFFRVTLNNEVANPNQSRWKLGQVYFAHMTLTDIDGEKFYYFERINRKGVGNAGADADRLMVWNEDWLLEGKGKTHSLKAMESGTGIELQLVPEKKLVIHGNNGISKKGSEKGNASHYFSYTRMKTTGQIFVKGEAYNAIGSSWMDHEYSSNQLNGKLVGWDWFSLKLDDQTELMLYLLRHKTGGVDSFSSGTFIAANGSSRHIKQEEFIVRPLSYWTSKKSGIVYPASWELELPDLGIELTLSPDLNEQELYNLRSISASYWEGSVSVEGTIAGNSIKGKGYVELVGYGKALMQDLPE